MCAVAWRKGMHQSLLEREGVSAVIGSANKGAVLEVIRRVQAGEKKVNAVGDIAGEKVFEPLRISRKHERTRGKY